PFVDLVRLRNERFKDGVSHLLRTIPVFFCSIAEEPLHKGSWVFTITTCKDRPIAFVASILEHRKNVLASKSSPASGAIGVVFGAREWIGDWGIDKLVAIFDLSEAA